MNDKSIQKKVEEINKKKLCATHVYACICVDRKREKKKSI